MHDNRKPGLFKQEGSRYEVAALMAPKTYKLSTKDNTSEKTGMKGVQLRNNPFTYKDYLDVLSNKELKKGHNVGFKKHDTGVYTYKQEKTAVSYVFCKRTCCECESCQGGGVTIPLW